mgnify:CR=1
MKDKIEYTDEPMGKLKIINDFLPPPDQLVLKEDNIAVSPNPEKQEPTLPRRLEGTK